MKKKEAADYLGISTRALERYVSLQRVGVAYIRGRTGDEAVFDEGELRRFKDQLSNHRRVRPAIADEASPSSETEPRTLSRLADVAPLAIFERMTAALEALKPNSSHAPEVPVADKLVLSLKEVSQLTGRSVARLREDCESGRLKAKKNEIARGWRVKKSDLDIYVKNL